MDSDPLTLTVVQAAKVLGISRALAYELVAHGKLPLRPSWQTHRGAQEST